MQEEYTLGIDAANIRLGGGITHLIELLSAFDPMRSSFKRIIIWGGEYTLSQLPNYSWLEKINPKLLNKNIFLRTLWQLIILRFQARKKNCSCLLVPGGIFWGGFSPTLVMSQNLLPFEVAEIRRYGVSIRACKFHIIKLLQSISFRRAAGIIFLTNYAKQVVLSSVKGIKCASKVIPHGLTNNYRALDENLEANIEQLNPGPIKILYVSNIDFYKHQIPVLKAVHQLRGRGYLLEVDFIGPAQTRALHELQATIESLDSSQKWARYLGEVPYKEVFSYYQKADLGVFASSCEAFGITLLEMMASRLPIACSNKSCLPEILENGGIYFDPENTKSIADAIQILISSPELRTRISAEAFNISQKYSWLKCAQSTFLFAEQITRRNQK